MDKYHIDFETRSKVSVATLGANKYARDPSTEVLCMAYVRDDDANVKIREHHHFKNDIGCPFNPANAIVYAHNVSFERAIWRHICCKRHSWPDVPDENWRCTAAIASSKGLPRKLKTLAQVLDLDERKDDAGHRVMMRLTRWLPATKTLCERYDEDPAKFDVLYEYCRQDVRTEREVHRKLGDLSLTELRVFLLDATINDRGLYLDTDLIRSAVTIAKKYEARLLSELNYLTYGKVTSVNQNAKFIHWLNEEGVNISNLQAATVEEMLPVTEGDAKRALEIRQTLGKASIKKLHKMLDRAEDDNRARGELIYHKAHTGRWAGTGIQIQNLPRGTVRPDELMFEHIAMEDADALDLIYGDANQVLSSALRGMIRAEPGNRLLVADFAGVEARGLAWLAGERNLLKQFRAGEDVYTKMAAHIYDTQEFLVSKNERMVGKVAVLGAGYGMGGEKFQATCEKWGVAIDAETADLTIEVYRTVNARIKRWWYDLNDAAIYTVLSKKPHRARKVCFYLKDDFLHCELPSGRSLSYYRPAVLKEKTPWGTMKDQLSYETELLNPPRWGRARTYGGKLAENITQAVCRDLLVWGMFAVEQAGYKIVGTVHDEVICEVDRHFGSVANLETLMCQLPSWAEGFPLSAEGYSAERFRK